MASVTSPCSYLQATPLATTRRFATPTTGCTSARGRCRRMHALGEIAAEAVADRLMRRYFGPSYPAVWPGPHARSTPIEVRPLA